jgi:hypothetical protein
MRNTLIVLLAGSVLCGCQLTEKSGFHDDSASGTNSPGNNSPIIGGNPPPATLFNEMYDFEPDATDPDGDSLSFTIVNKPHWASFESWTGRLFGQPSLGDVGTYENIVISVSDGADVRSLPAFSVAVSQSALGSVSLSWVAPTQNADGSPLVDLAGYQIHYGRSSGLYDHVVRIDSPGITTYVVDNLVPDTYYFAATSFNSSGVESEYSGEAVRTIN